LEKIEIKNDIKDEFKEIELKEEIKEKKDEISEEEEEDRRFQFYYIEYNG
jgi:hypothetical protein